MLQNVLNTTTTPLLAKTAEFAERRHGVLVENIAHINTPGYKVRDLPVDAFEQAIGTAVTLQRTCSPGYAGELSTAEQIEQLFTPELKQAQESAGSRLTFQDAGNRSVEREVMEMTKNVMLQNLAVQLMTAQMNQLQAVISERP